MKYSQKGVMLLEAMIAILIFSMGILAIIGMQARSIALVSDSMFRSQASFLTNEIIGQIWVNRVASNNAATNNVVNFAYPGGSAPELAAWITKVHAELPGSEANPPTIAVVTATNTVTVTVRWQPPSSTTVHSLVSVVQVSNP
jgi:type IV pilus assembly protein PilV